MAATVKELWDETTRPKFVADTLMSIGAEKLLAKVGLDETVITGVASMTTVAGLREKKAEFSELAAPIIEKAYTADGRKALADQVLATEIAQTVKAKVTEKLESGKAKVTEKLESGKAIATEKLESGKAFAAPYIATVKETSAPYVAKLEAIRRSERVEAMVAAFQEAREHPKEKVGELRAAAVDLIKYENLQAYREHIMSAEFQADTARLIKEDLPAIASSAAKRGAETIKSKAMALSSELDVYKEKATEFAKASYDKMPTQAEVQAEFETMRAALMVKGSELVAELQSEITDGVTHVKTEGFTMADALERLKRVVAVVDKIVVKPLKAKVLTAEGEDAPTAEITATEAEVTEAAVDVAAVDGETVAASVVIKGFEPKEAEERPLPINAVSSNASATEEEEMLDAIE